MRGDVLELFPAYEDLAVRIEFFGDEIERMSEIDPLTGEVPASDASTSIRRITGLHPAAPECSRANQSSFTNGWNCMEAEGKLLESAA